VRALAGDELNAVENFVRGIVEIVDNDDFIASLKEGDTGEGANVAAATVFQNQLESNFTMRRRRELTQ